MMICFNCDSSIEEGAGFIMYEKNELFCGESCAKFYYNEIVGISIENDYKWNG